MPLLITTLALLAGSTLAGPKADWPSARVAKVTAYAMNAEQGRPECLMPIVDGKPCASVVQSVTLTEGQARDLRSLLSAKKSYGQPEPKCFIPHHGFAFWDKDDKLLGQVGVCMMCSNLRADRRIPGQPQSANRSALSDAARQQIRGLCVELGLPMCDSSKGQL